MSTLTGTRHLVRLILRRDRVCCRSGCCCWPCCRCRTRPASSRCSRPPPSGPRTPTGTARNPSIVALLGPVYGDSVGALTAQRGGFLLLIVALASLLTVIRHTRTEEEAGRAGTARRRPCSAGTPG